MDGATYHLYATEESGGCGMTSWKANSQVVHAVAQRPAGPYVRTGLAVPLATNPCVFYDNKTSSFRMLILPTGTAGKQHHCGNGSVSTSDQAKSAHSESTSGRQMYVSKTAAGPWMPGTQDGFPNCNNPSGAT